MVCLINSRLSVKSEAFVIIIRLSHKHIANARYMLQGVSNQLCIVCFVIERRLRDLLL